MKGSDILRDLAGAGPRGLLLVALAALAASVLIMSCSSRVETPTKVIFVGVDAADWGVMQPLLDQGRLPNFARLLTEGATGRLATLQPLQKSPIIWTTIATGMQPRKHGIGGFLAPAAEGDSVPFTRNVRRVKALWNILGEQGMRVAVVGWLVTWPAEKVNGYLVSDYSQYENEKSIELEGQTYPEALFDEIDGMRLTEGQVTDGAIAELYPISAPPSKLHPEDWHKGYVKMVYATDETFRRIALHLAKKDVQFLAVYFVGVDSVCHAFWDFRDKPDNPLSEVIDDYYVWMDGVLGEFMDLVDKNTLLVVCSDHGFKGAGRTADGALLLGIHMHGDYGIIALVGSNVAKGARIPNANVIDVAPTVLYALGCPVARDMDGSVLTDAFKPEFLKSSPPAFVATYETGGTQPGEPIRSPVDEKFRNRLKAVGYIQ
jgi:predicted AlkP superfamily phosphohydrolase/phosphomutase